MFFADLLRVAIAKAGKQETLASYLEIGSSELSRRIAGNTGWSEKEIDKMLNFTGMRIAEVHGYEHKLTILKGAMKILLNDDDGAASQSKKAEE